MQKILNIKGPEKECNDKNCPFHGNLATRGYLVSGEVIAAKMKKTIVVKRELKKLIPKYERYLKKTTKLYAHLPDCINVNVKDKVMIAECRPLSKTKRFVVVQKLEG
jgi:small subunit ribosomal protein S17